MTLLGASNFKMIDGLDALADHPSPCLRDQQISFEQLERSG